VHDGSGRIVVQNLSKTFGRVNAVQNLSFQVEPGSVTGFLGPNGAGKTTTLRMLLGLVTPTGGHATINGNAFNHLGNPGRVVGAVLEAQGFHPKRSARNHLRVYTAAMGLPDQRADEVLHLVGLRDATHRPAGAFSLGMKQRLALATALLGDPQVLVLDEPANGLDPEGIAWLRGFLRSFASNGRTVLISSHLLAEVEQTIDQVVIISRGQTMFYGKLDDLRGAQQGQVVVEAGNPEALTNALRGAGITSITPAQQGNRLTVAGATARQIGDLAFQAGTPLYWLQEERADLEQMFFRLTSGQFSGAALPGQQPPPPQHQPPQQLPPQPPPGYGTPSGGFPQQGYQQGTPSGSFPQQGYQQQPPPQQQPPQQGWPQQGGWGGNA
jgi:ABC-2 type transport system ATP-binding protein